MTDKVVSIEVARARRRISGHFIALQAIEPESAIEFVPETPDERRQFERLLADGVIRERMPGYYWLDLDVHEAAARRGRRWAPWVAAAVVALAWWLTWFYRG